MVSLRNSSCLSLVDEETMMIHLREQSSGVSSSHCSLRLVPLKPSMDAYPFPPKIDEGKSSCSLSGRVSG